MAKADEKTQIVLPSMLLSATSSIKSSSLAVAFPGDNFFHQAVFPGCTFAAGRTLAAGFIGVKVREVFQNHRHVDRIVHDDGAARSKHGAVGFHAFIRQGQVFAYLSSRSRRGRKTRPESPPSNCPSHPYRSC